jgi:hypothetical protein
MPLSSFAVLASFSVVAGGCVHEMGVDGEVESPPSAQAEREDSRPVAVAYDGPVENPPPPQEAEARPPGPRVQRDPMFFHLGAGYGALGQVDLEPCRDHGLPRGYVRVRVTFRTDGRVAHAALQSDVLPSPEALACVGERLEMALVPAFEGGDVTLSKSFFVD